MDVIIQANIGEIQSVADLFVDLQDMRDTADYDPGAIFQRSEVLQKVGWVENAFGMWPTVRNTPEANCFLISLLLWEKWGKRA
jgi:hypothetical protein